MDPIAQKLMMMAASKSKQPKWVIGGGSGLLMASDDAVTWAPETPSVSADWHAGVFALGKFVLVGGDGSGPTAARAMFSADGVTWSTATRPNSYPLVAVAAGKNSSGNDRLVALYNGGSSRNWTSPDGETWTNSGLSLGADDWVSICPANSLFNGFLALRASSSGSDTTARVSGGNTQSAWNAQSSAAQGEWRDICYSADLGLAVAVGEPIFTNSIMTSNGAISGGTTWTVRTPPTGGGTWTSICWGGGRFVGMSSGYSMVSTNGTSWTRYAMPNSGSRLWYKVAYGDGKYVAIGFNNTFTTTYVATSLDGQTWSEVASFASPGSFIAYGEI